VRKKEIIKQPNRMFAKYCRIGGILALLTVFGTLLAIALDTPVTAATGINERLNYQARLLDSTGAVVADGTYNIEFKIYQDGDGCESAGSSPCSGTLKWTETRTGSNKVTVANGYFSVQLGSVTAFGTSVDWNQDALWLSLNVGGTGAPSWDGEMLPFRRLAATPYALNSKQLGGLDWSKFVQIAPSAVQVDASTLSTLFLNKTGVSGNILQLQKNGANVVVVGNDGSTVFSVDADFTLAETENVNITNTVTGTNALDLFNTTITNNTSSGTQRAVTIQNAAGSGATEALLSLNNADTDTAVGVGLEIASAAGAVTTAIDVSDADIVDALSVGANNIVGTTGDLNFSNFDVLGASGNTSIGGTLTVSSTYNTNTFTSSSLQFGAAGTATVQSAATRALTITAHATSTWSTDSGDLSLQAATNLNIGNGGGTTINIGTNNAAHTIGIGNTGATGTQAITIGGSANTANTVSIEAGTGAGSIAIGNGNTAHNIQIGSASGTAQTVTIGSTNASSALTLQGNSITVNSATIQRTAAGTTTFNLIDSSNTLLSITNSGAGTASLNVDGGYQVAGTPGSSVTCSGGQFLQNQVVSGGIVTGGTCAAAGSGSQTPWTQDIDADGFDLNDLSNILFRESTGVPASTDVAMYRDNAGDLSVNVLTGKTFNVQVNGADEYNFSSTTLDLNGNTITGAGNLTATGAITIASSGAGNDIIINGADILDVQDATTFASSITTSNLGVEFTESDTNPTCAAGNYNIFADASETKLKKCVNGVVSDIGAGDKYETFTASGTYTKPSDAALIIVDMWGAGGGGGGGAGGSNAAARTGGGGGGGGAFVTSTFLAANIGSSAEVTIGAGGTAGTAGANAVGGNGTAGGNSCFGTAASCGGTSYLRAFGGGFGAGAGAAGNGGGGGGGSQSVGSNASSATFGAGGAPLHAAGASALANSGFGGGSGGTAGTGTVAGGQSNFGGGGGAPSTTAGGANSGAGGASNRGGGAGGGGGSCAITTCTARQGGAGGATNGGAVAGGTGGSAANGGAGNAGNSAGGSGGGGGATNAAGAGFTGGAGGIPGGAGGGGGAAHTGSTTGGAGGAGARGEVRVWTVRGSGADLAEIYGTKDPDMKPGDVVCLDASLQAGVKKCAKQYDPEAIGIITTTPGLVIGAVEDKDVFPAPVVLAGRTPVSVSNENGPIKAGDLLTTSSRPGVAMKAGKAGQIIGQAMAPFDGEGLGMTVAFVKTGYSVGQRSSIAEATDPGTNLLTYLMSEENTLKQADGLSEVFTDRVVAGLEITAPKVTTDKLLANSIESAAGSDIMLKLADSGRVVGVNAAEKEAFSFDSNGNAAFALNLTAGGGLTVGGKSEFRGSALFYDLVTFVEKTVFKNDISLEGHVLTAGAAPTATAEAEGGAALSDKPRVDGTDTAGQLSFKTGQDAVPAVVRVVFAKPYAKAPKVLLTPTSRAAAELKYYVESTPNGYAVTFTTSPPPGVEVTFNYWVAQ
jgi:hypothetical protein